MTLSSTQLLTDMITVLFSGCKVGRCVGLTHFALPCADSLDNWETQSPGTIRVSPRMFGDYFTFIITFTFTCTLYSYHLLK